MVNWNKGQHVRITYKFRRNEAADNMDKLTEDVKQLKGNGRIL